MAKFSYKKSMDELEQIVNKLESDEPNIDELSGLVHKASELITNCRKKLRDTQSEIDKTMETLEKNNSDS